MIPGIDTYAASYTFVDNLGGGEGVALLYIYIYVDGFTSCKPCANVMQMPPHTLPCARKAAARSSQHPADTNDCKRAMRRSASTNIMKSSHSLDRIVDTVHMQMTGFPSSLARSLMCSSVAKLCCQSIPEVLRTHSFHPAITLFIVRHDHLFREARSIITGIPCSNICI
jgi:hypothetical protein